jgi:hypothetical protein
MVMFLKRFNTVVCLIAIVTTMSAYVHAGWEEVDDARRKGLPKTAIEALGPVIEDAMAHGRHAEAIKAICTRIAFEASIEGARAEERITRLEAELEKAPEPMRPMMQAILANWYWHYFQQNRWRFMQRTQTAEPPGDDFTTWDLPRILAEIDTHFTAALAKEEILKAIPIAQFDDLLEKGNTPDAYRPPSLISWHTTPLPSIRQASRERLPPKMPSKSMPQAPSLPHSQRSSPGIRKRPIPNHPN